jgi:hypothetical protein
MHVTIGGGAHTAHLYLADFLDEKTRQYTWDCAYVQRRAVISGTKNRPDLSWDDSNRGAASASTYTATSANLTYSSATSATTAGYYNTTLATTAGYYNTTPAATASYYSTTPATTASQYATTPAVAATSYATESTATIAGATTIGVGEWQWSEQHRRYYRTNPSVSGGYEWAPQQ